MPRHLKDPDSTLSRKARTLCGKGADGRDTTNDPYQTTCKKCLKLFKKAMLCSAMLVAGVLGAALYTDRIMGL